MRGTSEILISELFPLADEVENKKSIRKDNNGEIKQ